MLTLLDTLDMTSNLRPHKRWILFLLDKVYRSDLMKCRLQCLHICLWYKQSMMIRWWRRHWPNTCRVDTPYIPRRLCNRHSVNTNIIRILIHLVKRFGHFTNECSCQAKTSFDTSLACICVQIVIAESGKQSRQGIRFQFS